MLRNSLLAISPAVVAGVFLVTPASTSAQAAGTSDSARSAAAETAARAGDVEHRARESRSGAGLRVGSWTARGLPAAGIGERLTSSPVLEGYFQKGLDLHLALENTATVYWQDRTTRSSSLLGGATESRTRTYVVPLFTSLKVMPFTGPGARLEPYALGGLGFALGVEDPDQGSATLGQGVGVKGGTGLSLRLGDAFGVSVGGRWQWIRFLGDFANTRTVQGFGADVGLTYRFQYR